MKHGQLLVCLAAVILQTNAWALLPEKDAGERIISAASGGASSTRIGYRTISNGRQTIYLPQPAGAAYYAPTADQKNTIETAERSGVIVERHSLLGLPVCVRGTDLGQRKTYSRGSGLQVKDGGRSATDAIAVVDNLSGVFGIRNAQKEFTAKTAESDHLGYRHTRLAQRYNGLRVIGGQLVAHFDNLGRAYEVNGRYITGIDLETTPNMDDGEALEAAQADLQANGKPVGESVSHPELVVYALNCQPQLAYELTLEYTDENAILWRWRYWVDAFQGTILNRFNDIKTIGAPSNNGTTAVVTGNLLAGEGGGSVNIGCWHENTGYYYLYNKTLYWYVYNVAASGYADASTYAYRATANWGTSDRTEISAARCFDMVQSYFRDVHGRKSFDNNNAYARANVHQGTKYVNAYWDGNDFHFGDGDGVAANALAVLDVCGHEFTHGVTEYTSDLMYYGESGALNESFSDIFGTCMEFYAQPDGRSAYPGKSAGAADWLCGEDCWLESTALRDLRNPANTATVGSGNEQPTKYCGAYWYSGSGDNGGVHQNNGVQNFFFYLLSEGGRGTNDGIAYNVTGIGVTNAEQIAYRALTVYCGQYTDYDTVREAWQSATRDLNSGWTANVAAAWSAVYPQVTNENWTTKGLVYAPMAIGANGHIYATSTGSRLYEFDCNGTCVRTWKTTSGIYDSPVIGPDGTIYVCDTASRLYAFNPDGTTKFISDPSLMWCLSQPAVSENGSIYLLAQDAEGFGLREFLPDGSSGRKWNVTYEVLVIKGPPVIGKDGMIYVSFLHETGESGSNWLDSYVYSFDLNGASGQPKHIWRVSGAWDVISSGVSACPAIGPDGSVYIATYYGGTKGATGGRMYSLNPNGTINKVYQFPSNIHFSQITPVISSNGMIYLPGLKNKLFVINSNNGRVATNSISYQSSGELYWPSIDRNGKVYMVDSSKRMVFYNSDGTEYWSANVDGSSSITPLIGSNGKIYIGNNYGSYAKIFEYSTPCKGLASGAWPSFFHDSRNTCCYSTPSDPPVTPTGISASDGTYSDKVMVTWNAVSRALSYNVYRNTANNPDSAQVLASNLSTTAFNDTTAGEGVTCYYWVKAVNMNGTSGFSQSDSGYRSSGGGGGGDDGPAPSVPAGVFASDGKYSDKVLVYWDAVSSATSYKVWRSTDNNAQNASAIGTCTAAVYLDTAATAGAVYYYWIQAVNKTGDSDFSASDSGYCCSTDSSLASPANVMASDGAYTKKIGVTWQAANNAAKYEVWRALENDFEKAVMIEEVSAAAYNDTSAGQGVCYYYWVRAKNAYGYGGYSASDSGWKRLSPPAAVSAGDGQYPYHIQVSWNAVANAGWYEVWREEVPGENSNNGNLCKVAEVGETSFKDYQARSGVYYRYKVKACNGLSSSEYATDTGVRLVNASTRTSPPENDYDGDKLSDLALFNSSSGVFDVLCSGLGEQTFAFNVLNSRDASGDLDGDQKADPLVYCQDSAMWLVMFSNIGYAPIVRASFGIKGDGVAAATADYDGDGLADPAVYRETDGQWFIVLSGDGTFSQHVACSLGGPGYFPVSADYDGDRLADPAVYSETEGKMTAMLSGNGYSSLNIGLDGAGQTMCSADFDGDGKADPALYGEASGQWTILLSGSGYCAANISLGGPGYSAAIGDYDGDGKADPAVYRRSDGQWLILISSGGYSAITENFGGSDLNPVVRVP